MNVAAAGPGPPRRRRTFAAVHAFAARARIDRTARMSRRPRRRFQ